MMFNHDVRDVKRCPECDAALTVLDEETAWTLCLSCGATMRGPATVLPDDETI